MMQGQSLFKKQKSPIQEQIKKETLKAKVNINTEYLRLPVFGKDDYISDATLKVIDERCSLSSSYTAAIDDLASSAFDNGVNVIDKPIDGLASYDISELPTETQKAFLIKLKDLGFSWSHISEVLKQAFKEYEKVGNGYIQIKYVEVGSSKKFFFESIAQKCINYRAPRIENNNKVEYLKRPTFYISPSWDMQYLKDFPPQEIPATQMSGAIQYGEYGGIKSTILHIRNYEGNFYGIQNKVLAVLEWMLAEFNLSDTTSKISASETVSNNVFVFKQANTDDFEGNTEDEKVRNARQFRQNRHQAFRKVTTSEGEEPSTIAIIEALEPTEVQKFELNISRDSAYNKWVTDTAQNKIYGALGTSPRQNGASEGKNNLGGNANSNEQKILSKRVTAIQSRATNIIDRIFECMFELVQDNDLINYSLKLPNPLEVLNTVDTKNDTTINTAGSN